MITHSAKELGQQKEQWVWGLKVATKWGGGGGGGGGGGEVERGGGGGAERRKKKKKKGGGGGSQYGRVCIK